MILEYMRYVSEMGYIRGIIVVGSGRGEGI